MSSTRPIETKVVAAISGAGGLAAFSQFVCWLLGVTVWDASNSAGSAVDAVAAVPGPVAAIITIVLTAVGAGVAGYIAPHTTTVADTDVLLALGKGPAE